MPIHVDTCRFIIALFNANIYCLITKIHHVMPDLISFLNCLKWIIVI